MENTNTKNRIFTIAVESSTWNNIGDAFYQNSIISQLRSIFTECDVVSFDGPFDRAFRPGKHEKFVFDSRYLVDADHYVFSGPIVGKTFKRRYAPLILEILRRGKTYSLLSVHATTDKAIMQEVRQFLEEHPPVAVHTRDHPSFEKLQGITPAEMDGICFAFFVDKMPHLPNLSLGKPYICSSYYRGYEPNFVNVSATATDLLSSGLELEWPKQLSQRQWRLMRFFEHRRASPDNVGPWKVVRPVHSFSPLPQLIFSKANSYISYNPFNFLAIYKYCAGVLTDRVHAGVAGLSFGKPVRVEQVDGRFKLFERVPVIHENGFMHLAPGALEPFHLELTDWLKSDFAAAVGVLPGKV
ncbi:polysaccharide pyruvyl transferase family protein [Martelella mangrovi]|uniref:Polysaccharide pyruvyl transferase domain-containing protein n=1 Tax=Martelella mangrovi TaxID=1397477 RepID=A0ABV2I6F6_9HYPH